MKFVCSLALQIFARTEQRILQQENLRRKCHPRHSNVVHHLLRPLPVRIEQQSARWNDTSRSAIVRFHDRHNHGHRSQSRECIREMVLDRLVPFRAVEHDCRALPVPLHPLLHVHRQDLQGQLRLRWCRAGRSLDGKLLVHIVHHLRNLTLARVLSRVSTGGGIDEGVHCRTSRFFRMRFMPSKTDRARLNQKLRIEEKAAFVAHIQQKIRQSRRNIRSGYAFSQQEGWGPLITSGRMQSKSASRVRPSQLVNVSDRDTPILLDDRNDLSRVQCDRTLSS